MHIDRHADDMGKKKYVRPQDFDAEGESTRTTCFHLKTKEFISTRFSMLAILPH